MHTIPGDVVNCSILFLLSLRLGRDCTARRRQARHGRPGAVDRRRLRRRHAAPRGDLAVLERLHSRASPRRPCRCHGRRCARRCHVDIRMLRQGADTERIIPLLFAIIMYFMQCHVKWPPLRRLTLDPVSRVRFPALPSWLFFSALVMYCIQCHVHVIVQSEQMALHLARAWERHLASIRHSYCRVVCFRLRRQSLTRKRVYALVCCN